MERFRLVNEGELVSDESEYLLNAVLVFEDAAVRRWAVQAFERVQWASQMQIRSTEWRVRRLLDEHDFPQAVEAAARADVIVVALHAAGGLPIPLCVWVTAWLPRRLQRPGALLAWIRPPKKPGSGSSRAHEYLQAVARKAGLDFLPSQARPRPELERAGG